MTIQDLIKKIGLKGNASSTEHVFLKINRPSTAGVESVPIGNVKSVKILMEGDNEPAEFISELKFGKDNPAQDFGMKLILTPAWAKSFAKGVNAQPGLTYLRGHEDVATYKDRAIPNGYVVGAKIEGDSLFLRNYLLPGSTPEEIGQKEQAQRELKAGLLSTSTGALTEFDMKEDENGVQELHAMKALKAFSNALVEYDQTGGDASVTQVSFKDSTIDKNNSNVIIPEDSTPEGNPMTVEEMLTSLKTHIENATVSKKDIALKLGIKVLDEDSETKLATLKSVEDKVGVPIADYVANNEKASEANFEDRKTIALKKRFEKDPAEILAIAGDLFTLKAGSDAEIEAEIKRVCETDSIKQLASKFAGGLSAGFSGGGASDEEGETEEPGPMTA